MFHIDQTVVIMESGLMKADPTVHLCGLCTNASFHSIKDSDDDRSLCNIPGLLIHLPGTHALGAGVFGVGVFGAGVFGVGVFGAGVFGVGLRVVPATEPELELEPVVLSTPGLSPFPPAPPVVPEADAPAGQGSVCLP